MNEAEKALVAAKRAATEFVVQLAAKKADADEISATAKSQMDAQQRRIVDIDAALLKLKGE